MAKFYVESGTLRAVIDSLDAERASLWAVHRAMRQIVDLEDDESDFSEMGRNDGEQVMLDDTIRVSEIGYNRDDAEVFETLAAFNEWYSLVRAFERLSDVL